MILVSWLNEYGQLWMSHPEFVHMLSVQFFQVDVPKTITHHIMYLIWSCMCLGVAPRTDTKKRHVFKRDWTMWSKHDNRYMFSCQQNYWMGWLYEHFTKHNNLHFDKES